MDVLQRHVHVARDFRALGNRRDEFVGPVRGMRVKQANPEFTRQRVQRAQQRAKRGRVGGQRTRGGGEFLRRGNRAAVLRAQVEAVVRRVLRNQVQLLHAVGEQAARFLDDVGLRAAAMRAAHPRNDAETARVIAALGNLHVREMFGREPEARRVEIRNEIGPRVDLDNRRVTTARSRGGRGDGRARLAELRGAAQ